MDDEANLDSETTDIPISFKSAALVVVNEEDEDEDEDDDGDDMTLSQFSNTPKHKLSSSSAKTPKPMEGNEMIQKAKKRLADWKMNHAVSGPGGKFMSFEQNKAANEELCSPGEFKSSAVMRALKVRSNLESEFPSFVKSLVRSDVASCFSMGLPGTFCKSHLPGKDITMILEDEAGKQFQVKYIAYKTGLSAGWRQFSAAHKLMEGNVLVFQLVGPTKFKVYVIRANDMTEVDGALGLLNLESHTKYNDAGKDAENKDIIYSEILNKKRPKTVALNMAEKKKRSSSSKLVSKNKSEEIGNSEILETFYLSQPPIPFKNIKSFEEFTIIIDGLSIDSEIHKDMRKKYYKLCCSQNMFLHENLIQGLNRMLIIGTISQTIYIADGIKDSNLSTGKDEFSAWDKTLRAFQLLGMNVGFLRVRLCKLSSLAYESNNVLDIRKSVDATNEQVQVQDEIKSIEEKLVELREACDRFGAAIGGLNSKAEIYRSKFQEEVSAPW